MMIREIITRLVSHENLSPEEATSVMSAIMGGQVTEAQVGSILVALRMKGETSTEIASFARVMREFALTTRPMIKKTLVDTCGTGGDGMQTFNISTTAAFVAAGAGVPVVKHGNRGVSSPCGSADVLSALGVNLSISREREAEIVRSVGIVFLFAPDHHPALRYVTQARKEIGCRTVFNLLGPLANPAGAQAQVLGVYHPSLTMTIADVLRQLGLRRAMVVHGDGLDEITTTGTTVVSELRQGCICDYTLQCEDFGFTPVQHEDLKGGHAEENARILRGVLEGEHGAARDVVLMNAGAAIYVGGQAPDLRSAIICAERSVDSGAAMGKLNGLIEATRSVA